MVNIPQETVQNKLNVFAASWVCFDFWKDSESSFCFVISPFSTFEVYMKIWNYLAESFLSRVPPFIDTRNIDQDPESAKTSKDRAKCFFHEFDFENEKLLCATFSFWNFWARSTLKDSWSSQSDGSLALGASARAFPTRTEPKLAQQTQIILDQNDSILLGWCRENLVGFLFCLLLHRRRRRHHHHIESHSNPITIPSISWPSLLCSLLRFMQDLDSIWCFVIDFGLPILPMFLNNW